jgi:hypothetical protein
MTRNLGSFNRRVHLERHNDDHRTKPVDGPVKDPLAVLGYNLGVRRDVINREEFTPSNAEKFVNGRVVPPRQSAGMRMAGVELRNQLQQM